MKSTLRIVGEGIAWNTAASLIVKTLVLVNIFLVLAHLSVYEYGLVQLVLTVVVTVGGVLLPGLGSVLTADLARERGAGNLPRAASLARQYFLFQLVLGTVAFLILFFGSGLLASYLHRPEIGYFLSIMAFSFLASPVRNILSVLTVVELRFALQSILTILDEAVKFLLLIIMFFVFHMGIGGVLVATAFAPLVVVILVFPWALTILRPLASAPKADEPWWRLVTSHRFWGIASSYLSTLNQNARLWFVQLFLGTEAVGLFAFAEGLASQAIGLVTFSSIATPIIARITHDRKRFADLANRATKYQLWIALILLVPGLIATPFFIDFFFPAYHSAILITLITLITLIPSAVNVAVSAVYAALKQQRQFFFRATLVKSALIVLLLPILIPLFGLVGVVIEFVLTNVISVAERTRSIRPLIPGFMDSPRSLLTFERSDRETLHRLLISLQARVSYFRKS